MSEAQAAPQISGQMFLYEKPELLTKEQHGDLKLRPATKPFSFAAKARAIPITFGEIPSAMKDYPLIFMSQEEPVLLAVTGLYDDVNLYVDEDGKWEEFRYIPGYVRRYPFGLAGETEGDRMAIVIDRAFEGLSADNETPLFENGELAQGTQDAVEFCKGYETDRLRTTQFTDLLKELDLIQPQSGQYTPQGATDPVSFAQYYGIDEKRLYDLPDAKMLELRKSGMLALAYAQIMSMGNWRLLLQRRAKRFNLTDANMFPDSAKLTGN